MRIKIKRDKGVSDMEKALLKGKHVLVEKPSTVSVSQTGELVRLAESRQLALHENYMFQYHSQIKEIKAMLAHFLRLCRKAE